MTKIVIGTLLFLLAAKTLGDWMMPDGESGTTSDVASRTAPSATDDVSPVPGPAAASLTNALGSSHDGAQATAPSDAPPALWLITNAGIAISPQRALPGHTVALLYSSWCPKVRSSLSRVLQVIEPVTSDRRIVALFANGELSQLLDKPEWLESEGVSRTQQAQLRRQVEVRGLGTGLQDNDYAYPVDQAYPRFRVPRAQWEALGGRSGGFKIACFFDGVRETCPGELDDL